MSTFSIKYNKHFKYLDEIDEIRLRYDINDLLAYAEFFEKYKQARFVIDVSEEEKFFESNAAAAFEKLLPANPDLKVVFACKYSSAPVNTKLPYFFSDAVTSWEQLHNFIAHPVTDVLIGGDFCFRIKSIGTYLHEKNIKVRINPIINKSISEYNSALDFYIRPDDIDYYSTFVDVFEIYGVIPNVYYPIYAKDKRWLGDLNEIIPALMGLPRYSNMGISNNFGERRSDCGHRCYDPTRVACDLCKNSLELSNLLVEESKILDKIKD